VKLKFIYHSVCIAAFSFCLLALQINAIGQNKVRIAYVLDSIDVHKIDIDTSTVFNNNQLAKDHLTKQYQKLLNTGYFEASIDSIVNNDQQLTAYLNIGPKYNGINLNLSNLPVELKEYLSLNKSGSNVQLSLSQWEAINKQVLKYADDNGYPFAATSLVNTEIEKNSISATIEYKPNQNIEFDSLVIKGDAKLNTVFLQNLLAIKKGAKFKANKLTETYKTLEALPYLEQYRAPAVEFLSSGANVLLFVNNKKANQFDFVIGLLPQTQGFKLTGEGQLALNNTFGFGERLHLNYTNLPNTGRQLNIEVQSTYLPYLPFGLDIEFNLYIQDTSFVNRNFKAGILYPFKANNFFEIYFANDQSNLLEINEAQIIQTKKLPENLDWQTNRYGLHFHLENYNYRFNPTNGFGIDINASLGNRNVITNNRITGLTDPENPAYNFEFLYDSLATKTSKIEVSAEIEKFFPIKNNSTLKTKVSFAYFYVSESFKSVLESELYRIGGLHTLKGFDEASIFGNFYSIVSVEYRYLIAKRSFFSCFANTAFIENQQLKLSNENYSRLYYSAGLGLNFETSGGIFSLNYALGKEQYNNINFKAGKIHFGYLNVF